VTHLLTYLHLTTTISVICCYRSTHISEQITHQYSTCYRIPEMSCIRQHTQFQSRSTF